MNYNRNLFGYGSCVLLVDRTLDLKFQFHSLWFATVAMTYPINNNKVQCYLSFLKRLHRLFVRFP